MASNIARDADCRGGGSLRLHDLSASRFRRCMGADYQRNYSIWRNFSFARMIDFRNFAHFDVLYRRSLIACQLTLSLNPTWLSLLTSVPLVPLAYLSPSASQLSARPSRIFPIREFDNFSCAHQRLFHPPWFPTDHFR